MTRPPGYGAQLGDTLMKGSAARGEAVGAELDARAKALGDILGNIKGIAEVGGGAIAPDLLIDRFAGGETPIFGNEYAGMADRLRLAGMAKAASGGGGGGGGGSGSGGADGLKPGEMLLRDPNGIVTVAKTSEMDETFRAQLLNGSSGFEVVQMGPVYTGPIAGAAPMTVSPEEQAWLDRVNGGG
jgi:hypothetical protein